MRSKRTHSSVRRDGPIEGVRRARVLGDVAQRRAQFRHLRFAEEARKPAMHFHPSTGGSAKVRLRSTLITLRRLCRLFRLHYVVGLPRLIVERDAAAIEAERHEEVTAVDGLDPV
jgi:hypothetical protein